MRVNVMIVCELDYENQRQQFRSLVSDSNTLHFPASIATSIQQDSLDVYWTNYQIDTFNGNAGCALIMNVDILDLDHLIDAFIQAGRIDDMPQMHMLYRIADYDQLPLLFDPMPDEVNFIDLTRFNHRHEDPADYMVQDHYDDVFIDAEHAIDIIESASLDHYYETTSMVFVSPEDITGFAWQECTWLFRRHLNNALQLPIQYPQQQQPTQQQIDQLLQNPSSQAFVGDGYCCICLQAFSNPSQLPCNHTFCTACITQSLLTVMACPLCRRDY